APVFLPVTPHPLRAAAGKFAEPISHFPLRLRVSRKVPVAQNVFGEMHLAGVYPIIPGNRRGLRLPCFEFAPASLPGAPDRDLAVKTNQAGVTAPSPESPQC